MTLDEIIKFIEKHGFFISEQQKRLLKEYSRLLREWNRKIHLISKNDERFVEERHILPSLLFVKAINEMRFKEKLKIIDLGTGAGLPGVVVSILLPKDELWLVDSSRKKTLFLKKVKQKLNLDFDVVNDRFERWVQNSDVSADIIMARAVTSLDKLFLLAKPLLENKKTILMTLKACALQEKIPKDVKEQVSIKIMKNSFSEISDYMKNKCLLKMEYVHG